MMDLRRLGIKFFCAEGATIPLVEFIPIFHRWIQQRLTDTTLIDVADYSHVPQGPGILLAAHQGNYSIDEARGRRGLAYYQKALDEDADLGASIERVARRALAVCGRLEAEPELDGRLRFEAGRFELFANDRLLAPNRPEAYDALAPQVEALATALYGPGDRRTERETDPRERLAFVVDSTGALDVATALARLDG